MDNRLDFYNYMSEYVNTLDEDEDSVLLMTYNKKAKDYFYCLCGDTDVFSYPVRTEEGEEAVMTDCQKTMVNIVYNMCLDNAKLRLMFEENVMERKSFWQRVKNIF